MDGNCANEIEKIKGKSKKAKVRNLFLNFCLLLFTFYFYSLLTLHHVDFRLENSENVFAAFIGGRLFVERVVDFDDVAERAAI